MDKELFYLIGVLIIFLVLIISGIGSFAERLIIIILTLIYWEIENGNKNRKRIT